MLRLKDFTPEAMNVLTNDIERRIARLEKKKQTVSGYTQTYNESTGKLVLTNGDVVVSFTKD